MTRRELAKEISLQSGKDIDECEKIIETLMKVAIKKVSKGETIFLRGFGTFKAVLRKEKVGQDIKWGKLVTIPARYTPVFKPCDKFKREVKNKLKPIESENE